MRRVISGATGAALAACLAGVSTDAAPAALLQDAAPGAAFEVASVKKSAPDVGEPQMIRAGARQGDTWLANNATLRMLVRSAYGPLYQMQGQIVGGPSWMDTDRFDVTAKMAQGTTSDDMRVMVQRLLAERFMLTAHTERRELTVFTLVLARSDGRLGPDMRRLEVDCESRRAAWRKGEARPPSPERGKPPECTTMMAFGPRSRILSGGITMAQLARALSEFSGRPVVDRTDLGGDYALTLEFAAEGDVVSPLGRLGPPATTSSNVTIDAASIFSALQDQLGLKLETRREPTDVLVIDGVEQPREN